MARAPRQSDAPTSQLDSACASIRMRPPFLCWGDQMRPLALALVLCGLLISGTSAADPTCKAKATKEKLTGEALVNFVKQCETDALLACGNKAAGKPDSDAFMDDCVVKAVGVGPRWCHPNHCKTNSECTGGVGCGVCWAGLC